MTTEVVQPNVSEMLAELSEIWKLVIDYFYLIATLLGLISFCGWIVGCRPRARRIFQSSFIDCESNQVFERTRFRISWGHVFFLRRMRLARIERNATFKILCKPLGGVMDILHMENYDEKSSGLLRNIYLVNKKYFKSRIIEEISLEITKPAPPDFRDKIRISQTLNRIEVQNGNHIEVRGVSVKLPETVTLSNVLTYSAYFNEWKTSEDSEGRIIAILKPIPACVGERPGRAVIQFS